MPKLIGKSTTVVEFEGLKIDELAGNVATSEDTISIARVTVDRPSSEPWLTLHYDEWICILKGTMELHYYESSDTKQANKLVLTATAGQTIMINSGERFRPVFPLGDCEYIPVCLPAFKPERCIREEETSEVSDGLEKLHAENTTSTKKAAASKEGEKTEIIYHMCEKILWERALTDKKAYYPPTFEQDGNFTHATGVPSRLLLAANHFYTSSQGDWICVELSHSALQNVGIITKFEEAKAVGDTDALTDSSGSGGEEDTWIYPHIFGGIPAHIDGIVTNIFPMKRDASGNFLSIEGL